MGYCANTLALYQTGTLVCPRECTTVPVVLFSPQSAVLLARRLAAFAFALHNMPPTGLHGSISKDLKCAGPSDDPSVGKEIYN